MVWTKTIPTTTIEFGFSSNGEPPAAMMAVYEYLHKRDIERAENVGVVQGLYKR